MATLPETNTFPTGVYQLELTDKAAGGVSGELNKAAKDLASRTLYLKNRTDAIYNKVDFYYSNPTPAIVASPGTLAIDGSAMPALTFPITAPTFTTPNDGITRTYKITLAAFVDFTYGATANIQMAVHTSIAGPTFSSVTFLNARQPFQSVCHTRQVTLPPGTALKATIANNATGANATFTDASIAIEEVL